MAMVICCRLASARCWHWLDPNPRAVRFVTDCSPSPLHPMGQSSVQTPSMRHWHFVDISHKRPAIVVCVQTLSYYRSLGFALNPSVAALSMQTDLIPMVRIWRQILYINLWFTRLSSSLLDRTLRPTILKVLFDVLWILLWSCIAAIAYLGQGSLEKGIL